MQEVEAKVRKLAEETISLHRADVESLCASLGTNVEEVIGAWVAWDTGINDYSNSIYSSNATRIAMHLHNFIPGNWHDKRQAEVLKLISDIAPKRIADVGFGTPQRYVTEYVLQKDLSASLLDFDQESLDFAGSYLDTQSKNWRKQVSLRKYDMNSGEAIGDFDLYLFQDSVEHADDPSKYFSSAIVRANRGSYFVLSMPIEVNRAVPEHNIFWKSTEDALGWVRGHGLEIRGWSEIRMNPDLDLFAKHLHPEFKEILVWAQKP
ncbi:MAG: hypothetical protein WC763_04075 [Candidatus Paceibacterota bacterium]|jgi:SAM-dependent methyltransferase